MQMYKEIPVADIAPSAANYRKHLNAEKLKELTASVKSKGVLEPVLVRPVKGKPVKFEVVAGHRRLKAAKAAGLKKIPAIVKTLTDIEALELQVVENTQREDPNAMDEAFGFKRLIDMGKYTTEKLAARLNRSVPYVTLRLRFVLLDKSVQDAILSEALPLGVAKLFTRLRNTADQKNLLNDVMSAGALTASSAARLMEPYFYNLAAAPFSTAVCKACPANSANQKALFPEIARNGECTDRSCFSTKVKQHYLDVIKAREKEGFKTFTDAAEIQEMLSGRSVVEISPCAKDASYDLPYPPDYKTECASCKEDHAFFLFEEHVSSGKRVRFGELCLNRRCLKEMQGEKPPVEKKGKKAAQEPPKEAPPKEEQGKEEQTPDSNPGAFSRKRARACIERFLARVWDKELKRLFTVDAEYLETFSREDLLKVVVELGIAPCDQDASKEYIVEYLLGGDNEGLMPNEVAEMFAEMKKDIEECIVF